MTARTHDQISTQQTQPAQETSGNKYKVAAVVALGGVAAVAAFNHISDDKNGSDNLERFELSSYSSVSVESGAKVRSEPSVSPNNDPIQFNMLEHTDKSTEAHGPVYTFKNEDGKWYGVPQENFGINDDNDGVVWVNEQRAEPNE